MSIAIKVDNLSKAYQLGEIGTGTISRDLERWLARKRGKEDPFLKIGEENDRTSKGTSDIVWSLRDINFEIKQGDAVGIIGRNGAGKSTLLKLLSRVTSPTTGSIKAKGRIASLLEVGTGFHPDLSGKENIFLNGAILGMRKKEIKRKFDEIVNFAGVERYIDTPVKRYSSGMYVRLAFAVAAHLDSEILIVDEVLAVGDAEFQKKCLGKMGEVSKGQGRTVLFVSHNMASVKQLCNKGIILKNGLLNYSGSALAAIKEYSYAYSNENTPILKLSKRSHSFLQIETLTINNHSSSPFNLEGTTLSIDIEGTCNSKIDLNIEIRISTEENILIGFYSPGHLNNELIVLEEGTFKFKDVISFPSELPNGEYFINIALACPNVEVYLEIDEIKFSKQDFITTNGRALNYNEIGFFLLKSELFNVQI